MTKNHAGDIFFIINHMFKVTRRAEFEILCYRVIRFAAKFCFRFPIRHRFRRPRRLFDVTHSPNTAANCFPLYARTSDEPPKGASRGTRLGAEIEKIRFQYSRDKTIIKNKFLFSRFFQAHCLFFRNF